MSGAGPIIAKKSHHAPKKGGALIYMHTNILTGKSYVGVTVFTMEERWMRHVWAAKTGHEDCYFHRAITKYGAGCWLHTILEVCPDAKSGNAAEAKWVRELETRKSGYNMTEGGDGMRNPAPETRAKLAQATKRLMTPERRKELAELARKQATPEARKAQAEFMSGPNSPNRGRLRPCSEATREKIRRANRMFTREQDTEILAARMSGQSLAAIAHDRNCSVHAILNALRCAKRGIV